MKLFTAIAILAVAGYTALVVASFSKQPSGDPVPTPPVRMFEHMPAGMGLGQQDPRPMLPS